MINKCTLNLKQMNVKCKMNLFLDWSSFCKLLFPFNDIYWIIYHHTEWLWCPWLGHFWSSSPHLAWSWLDAWSLWPSGSVINNICSYCSSCNHIDELVYFTLLLVSYLNVLGLSFKCTEWYYHPAFCPTCTDTITLPFVLHVQIHYPLHVIVVHTFPTQELLTRTSPQNPWLGKMTLQ